MYFTTLLILMLVMQAPTPGATSSSGIKVIQIEGGQGLILPVTVSTPWDSNAGTRWEPTEAQARDAEACLKSFLRKGNSSDQRWILQHLRRYKRQYAGISRYGKHQIVLNFFIDEQGLGWTSRFVQIDDGGRTVFQIFYDPASKTCFDFRMNGEA